MLKKIIEEKIKPGTQVKFMLKTGQEITGAFQSSTDEYVLVKDKQGSEEPTVLLLEFIGGWEILSAPNGYMDEDDDDSPLSGLPDDTVVDHVEIQWEDVKNETQNFAPWQQENQEQPKQKSTRLPLSWIILGALVLVWITLVVIDFLFN